MFFTFEIQGVVFSLRREPQKVCHLHFAKDSTYGRLKWIPNRDTPVSYICALELRPQYPSSQRD